MLSVLENKMLDSCSSRRLSAGEKVSRKYRRAAIRRAEYRKLKAIVPSVANKTAVSKLTVIEEAIKYIDHLHSALAKKILTVNDCGTFLDRPESDSSYADLFVHYLYNQQTLEHLFPTIQKPKSLASTIDASSMVHEHQLHQGVAQPSFGCSASSSSFRRFPLTDIHLQPLEPSSFSSSASNIAHVSRDCHRPQSQ